jgi:hypothetical protein
MPALVYILACRTCVEQLDVEQQVVEQLVVELKLSAANRTQGPRVCKLYLSLLFCAKFITFFYGLDKKWNFFDGVMCSAKMPTICKNYQLLQKMPTFGISTKIEKMDTQTGSGPE